MRIPFANKANRSGINILVIESNSALRSSLAEFMRTLELGEVTPFSNLRDALRFMETNSCHWILTPFLMHEEVNALHLLHLFSTQGSSSSPLVSVFADLEMEKAAILRALELGALSFHEKTQNLELLKDEIRDLLNCCQANDWNASLTAAEYVRSILALTKMNEIRVSFERAIVALFPGYPTNLINLGEALFLTGAGADGIAALNQAVLLQPGLAGRVEPIKNRYLAENSTEQSGIKQNFLNIDNILIIEPDESLHGFYTQSFKDIGASNLHFFNDPFAALNALKDNLQPQIIMMEWRFKNLNASVFAQRLRHELNLATPIVVCSSLVMRQDQHLLRELLIDDIVPKPMTLKDFYHAVIITVQKERMPLDLDSVRSKALRSLVGPLANETKEQVTRVISDPLLPLCLRQEIHAFYEYRLGNFLNAKTVAMEAFKAGGDTLSLINLVGKCSLKLNHFEDAIKCFESAQKFYSKNIDRLVEIAESSLNLDSLEKASEASETASSLDPASERVKETAFKVALEKDESRKAMRLASDLHGSANILSYINNRAVLLSQTGKPNEAINLYERALRAIPASWVIIKAKIYYNLALAHVRLNELDKAAKTLAPLRQQTLKSEITLESKIFSLQGRLKKHIEDHTPFLLSEGALPKTDVSKETTPVQVETPQGLGTLIPGELCCYLIFKGPPNKDIEIVYQKLPPFIKRRAITRQETLSSPKKKAG